jgi:hypothetical protein
MAKLKHHLNLVEMAQQVARQAHNLKDTGSKPVLGNSTTFR